MELLTSAKVQADSGGSVQAEKATTVSRYPTVCHSNRLSVLTAAFVIVTSLLICALGVRSIQQGIAVDKLQQQVADLQQTVAILHSQQQKVQQQQQQHIARPDIGRQQDELQATHYTQVSQQLLICHLSFIFAVYFRRQKFSFQTYAYNVEYQSV